MKCAARSSLEIQVAKIRHLDTIAQLCRPVSLQLRRVSTIGKKNLSPPRELGPLPAEICWHVWGTPAKFQRVSRVGFVTAASLVNGDHPNFARCLAVSWTGTLCIHFWRLLPSDGILPGAEFTLRPSFAFSYIGSVTARHSSKGRQPNQTLWH